MQTAPYKVTQKSVTTQGHSLGWVHELYSGTVRAPLSCTLSLSSLGCGMWRQVEFVREKLYQNEEVMGWWIE